MRKWVLRIHLYLGLICSSYLILFGVSSLNFNHPFAFTKPAEERVTWERELALPPVSSDDAIESDAVRDALRLVGWTIPWEMTRDAVTGDLHFGLARPGKHYAIHVRRAEGRVSVKERREGYWPVLRGLHGLHGVPRAPVATVWGWYTELCTAFVLFAAASGVYLFAARKRERWIGFAVLGLAVALSLLFMVYVRVWG